MNIETWADAYTAYDELLDEIHGDVEIAGYAYQSSYALRILDPIAYRTSMLDWLDAEDIDSDILTGHDDPDDH